MHRRSFLALISLAAISHAMGDEPGWQPLFEEYPPPAALITSR